MGNNPVIKIENLSKQYRLGEVGTGTISHDLNRWWHRIRGKEDPYLRVGESNDRTNKGNSDYVWALQDINFEVQQGEVLGVIGKNGAGKSTLLKILSKVTAPTTGSIKAKGRIASLLEVGTGFHPELTGRENIYLNGTILGMTKREVNAKLDEIVDFAGVERYLDTPVKRYSSGMMVRLGFAVAAHLEPEILIVDEVLAVGDAEFQKKAVGKMQDVSKKEGRTVLFVSHNMVSIRNLCTKGIVLTNGTCFFDGKISSAIQSYIGLGEQSSYELNFIEQNGKGNNVAKILSVRLINRKREIQKEIFTGDPIGIEIIYTINDIQSEVVPNILISSIDSEAIMQSIMVNPPDKGGKICCTCWFPNNFFNNKSYNLTIALSTLFPTQVHASCELQFQVEENINDIVRGKYRSEMLGFIRPKLDWEWAS